MHQPGIALKPIPPPHPLGLARGQDHHLPRRNQRELATLDLRQHRQPFPFSSTHQYVSFQHLPLFPCGVERGHFYRVATPVVAALPSCIEKCSLEKAPALLPPEDIEGLDFEDLAHPDIA